MIHDSSVAFHEWRSVFLGRKPESVNIAAMASALDSFQGSMGNAAMLAREGWTKQRIRQFISEHARMPFSKYRERFIVTGMARMLGGIPSWVFETSDPKALIPVPFIDQFLITVSGGPGEKSMLFPGWFNAQAIAKEIRLPAHWRELLNGAER